MSMARVVVQAGGASSRTRRRHEQKPAVRKTSRPSPLKTGQIPAGIPLLSPVPDARERHGQGCLPIFHFLGTGPVALLSPHSPQSGGSVSCLPTGVLTIRTRTCSTTVTPSEAGTRTRSSSTPSDSTTKRGSVSETNLRSNGDRMPFNGGLVDRFVDSPIDDITHTQTGGNADHGCHESVDTAHAPRRRPSLHQVGADRKPDADRSSDRSAISCWIDDSIRLTASSVNARSFGWRMWARSSIAPKYGSGSSSDRSAAHCPAATGADNTMSSGEIEMTCSRLEDPVVSVTTTS